MEERQVNTDWKKECSKAVLENPVNQICFSLRMLRDRVTRENRNRDLREEREVNSI